MTDSTRVERLLPFRLSRHCLQLPPRRPSARLSHVFGFAHAYRRHTVPTRPSLGARSVACAPAPPKANAGNDDRFDKSPSRSCRLAGLGPSGFRRCESNARLRAFDGPGPSPRTTRPTDRRIPNWSGRPGPFLATTAVGPNEKENTSWSGSVGPTRSWLG